MSTTTGVLLLAHGTPDSLEEMPEYLTRVRGGRPPSPALIEEMTHNYRAIGGRSPLTDVTRAQAEALAEVIGRPVYVGMRNWKPFVADTLAQAVADGIARLVAIPLAPQYSSLSVAKYQQAVEAARPASLEVDFVAAWYEHPLLLQAFAEKVRGAMAAARWDAVVFTAHSLPVRVIESGDPYAQHVRATAEGVASRAGLGKPRIAYQSAGRTEEAWLGPSVEEALAALAGEGKRSVLVVPIGFVSDHTEILYDIDIAARETARAKGLALGRTASLNTSPVFVGALAEIVKSRLG